MYIAVTRFADMQDANRIYEAGETYPRPGLDVTQERIDELAGSDNLAGYPLIAEVVEDCESCMIAPETPAEADSAKDEGIPAEQEKPSEKRPRKRVRKND